MKNYYEILEVDKNASDEVIKVAYKSLVKKYHPDLKEGQEKQNAENKIKEINEAYDILSDKFKKSEYDENLINENISTEEYNNILNENIKLKKELNYLKNVYNRSYNRNNSYSNSKNNYSADASNYYENFSKQNNYNNTTNNKAYTNNNYKSDNSSNINYSKNKKGIFNYFSESFKNVIAFFLTLLIFYLILQIPFTREFIINIFGNNFIFLIIIVLLFFYFFRNKP